MRLDLSIGLTGIAGKVPGDIDPVFFNDLTDTEVSPNILTDTEVSPNTLTDTG